jgi:hypothetical protein
MANMSMQQDDTQEYSLLDLIVMLYKHRKLFIYTILIITILGVIYAGWSYSKKQFIYRQPVQLASYYLDGKQYLLQGNTQVINAVNNLYVPRFIEQYKSTHPKFNETKFLDNFSVKSTFAQTQDQSEAISNVVYLEFKGSKDDLSLFQDASSSIVQQIVQQEKPMINSLIIASKSNLLLMQTEVPKLEKVGELLKSYSGNQDNNIHQEMAMTVSTRETYLDLISQSQTVQNVIQFKQAMNQLNQKIDSLTPTSTVSLIVMNANPKIPLVSMILLSFIIGLFIAILLVFIKVMSESIKTQLKLTK